MKLAIVSICKNEAKTIVELIRRIASWSGNVSYSPYSHGVFGG